jgi:hypothetical protein
VVTESLEVFTNFPGPGLDKSLAAFPRPARDLTAKFNGSGSFCIGIVCERLVALVVYDPWVMVIEAESLGMDARVEFVLKESVENDRIV